MHIGRFSYGFSTTIGSAGNFEATTVLQDESVM